MVVVYRYDPWGRPVWLSGSMSETLGALNPFRYRGYVYDAESGLYYLRSRYYNPNWGRFLSADSILGQVGGLLQHNLWAYCRNVPVNMADLDGSWPQWLTGIGNAVCGVVQAAVGACLVASAPLNCGFGAIAGGILLIDGAATATQGIGQIVNAASDDHIMREDNMVRTGVIFAGNAIAGETGENFAALIYDTTVFASSVYRPSKLVGQALQQAGVIRVRVPINRILNNPLDDFVTIGPANGVIAKYIRSIKHNEYYEIYVTVLPNGYYMLANGHHRVAALRQLGYKYIKVRITK